MTSETLELPLLPLRDIVVFPFMVIPLFVGRERSVQALEKAMAEQKNIFLAAQRNPNNNDPAPGDIYEMGTLANILQILKLTDGTMKVLVEGLQRGRIHLFKDNPNFYEVEVTRIYENIQVSTDIKALMRMYILPGLIDLHVHTGGVPKAPEAEYVYKLWLGHGITTVRGVPFTNFDLSLSEKERSAKNEITAPRMFSYHRPGSGSDDWKEGSVNDPETAKKWVRYIARKGADGMKLGSYPPNIMAALLDEAKNQNLGSTAHLAQSGVAQMNALDAARLGLGTVTHFYGLFESMYESNDVQPWPVNMNYNDEQHRFGQVARQWNLVKPRGDKWNALLNEFLALDLTLDPTMTIYAAGRDVMHARNGDWHKEYTLPTMWDFFTPSRESHGAYWFYWTTWDEVAWRNFTKFG